MTEKSPHNICLFQHSLPCFQRSQKIGRNGNGPVFEWDLKSRQRGPDFELLKSQIVSKAMLALAVLYIIIIFIYI